MRPLTSWGAKNVYCHEFASVNPNVTSRGSKGSSQLPLLRGRINPDAGSKTFLYHCARALYRSQSSVLPSMRATSAMHQSSYAYWSTFDTDSRSSSIEI